MWQLEHIGRFFFFFFMGSVEKSVLNISAGRKSDLWKWNVSAGRLGFWISAWLGASYAVRESSQCAAFLCVVITLISWHVLSSPVWLCAGSPILVMSGMCWWVSPRTWFWTHAQLLGDLSTRTSWLIVVRSWSFCTRWEGWLCRLQAEFWNSSYFTLKAIVILQYSVNPRQGHHADAAHWKQPWGK